MIEIAATVAPKIGFASHQNLVPLIAELSLVSDTQEPVDNLVLRLSASPQFIEARTWTIDRIGSDSTLHIKDRDIRLNGSFLFELNESVNGEISIALERQGETIANQTFPVELLARSEWGGAAAMPELLPAFSLPNDPAVDRVLKAASEVLRRAGKRDAIDGYTERSRSRSWELASAIWSATASFKISYALPPSSFELQGQKVRTPSTVLDGRVATCLDTALLFAAAFEQAGLNTVIILTQGHAFVGVWLQPQEFAQLLTYEASAIRKRVALNELLIFETTLVTQSPVPGFSAAIANAKRQLVEERDDLFVMAVDVRRARMQRIKPLAVSNHIAAVPVDTKQPPVSEALEAAPLLPGFDVEIPGDAPQTPLDRVELWQRKLLDLTTRNRLLHLPDNAKGLPLICPDPAILEDHLADGKRIRLVAAPDLTQGGRDLALHEQQTSKNLLEEYAQSALGKNEILSPLKKERVEAILIDLYRKARNDLEEGGANTLFLALGFLKWKKSADDPRTYRAPLILLPVKLDRKSALSGVTMTHHEDEPRFNLTLLELLHQDFALTIPGLDGPLPTDDKGIDVQKIWNIVRRAIRDVPGLEVSESVVLSTFSFSKYLMWRDLADRAEDLKQSPVVRHLMERGSEAFASNQEFPEPHNLDCEVDPAHLFTPLSTDSSQLTAIVASSRGCNFVLDGPPGTGKSQTIANMIAHNLALGRRVLFVAEKRAALEVVARRLEEKGLGDFCLTLHSNKTSKRDMLEQLDRAWNVRDQMTRNEWIEQASEVQRLRDRLNNVVRVLHTIHPNGLTIHGAIGRVVRDSSPEIPQVSWPDGTVHDKTAMATYRDIVRRLGISAEGIGGLPADFNTIASTVWSNGWQESIIGVARELPILLDELCSTRDRLISSTKLPITANDISRIDTLVSFAATLLATYGHDLRIAFAPDFANKTAAARQATSLIVEYHAEEAKLSVPFAPEAARHVSLAKLDTDWREADTKFWPFSVFAKKKVIRALAQQGGTSSSPNPDTDLPQLHKLADILTKLDQPSTSLTGFPGWASLASDTQRMETTIALAERVRESMSHLADEPAHLADLRKAVSTLIVEANDMLADHGPISINHTKLAGALTRFKTTVQRLAELMQHPAGIDTLNLDTLRTLTSSITKHENRLKAWCDWRRVRDEAMAVGLGPLVQSLETHNALASVISGLFETAYARWFASKAIDAEPLLREFVSSVHMDDIERYRALDTRLSELTVRYTRAKLCGKIPSKNAVSQKDGYGILKHQLQLQRPRKPIRQLAIEMGNALTHLAPCMLMSPLSIAQYLPAGLALFDLVIFDEASQITPWDAVGAIARGKQVVIAGDPRQMPPTNFFGRSSNTDEETDDLEQDMESILDECLAAGIPRRSLTWHYRSRHESLITFSNREYYGNSLITFPAPITTSSVVRLRRVDGIYAKGASRTNQVEAEALVAETVARLTDPEFIAAGKTLAIVTLNVEQQKLIEDLLDQARQRNPAIEPYFDEERPEPVVVKNLETVQGDERDLILLGIGYGPTEVGAPTMSMNFGPLNREGGWRRLNVAVTRARSEMVVFSSFDPSMIDLNRTSARAVRDLRHFLEFAERGPRALVEAVQGSMGSADSPFEEAVASALREKGWTVVPQIGVSSFRIDLGIVHPDRPGDYLVGIECDGASYHSAATARDRDKVRQDILETLGWKLLRVWSTDWWVDKGGATERLHAAIVALLEEDRVRDNSEILLQVKDPQMGLTMIT